MESLVHSIFMYWGLDWLTLIGGLYGMHLLTCKNRWGFLVSGVACLSGFSVALMSAQYGFVIYNLVLAGMMMRGFLVWKRDMEAASVPQRI